MSLINEKDYTAAKGDLSMCLTLLGAIHGQDVVDVECLVKRSYCHLKLKDLKSCMQDIETAQTASLHRASLIPEFVDVHEYIAAELTCERRHPLAISGLSKALAVLPNKKAPTLLIRQSFVYLLAPNPYYFQEDLDKARGLNYNGIKNRTLVDHLLSREGKVGYTHVKFFQPPL